MVLIRFTKELEKLRDHRKIQTLRKPRKRPICQNDCLDVYELRKIGNAYVTSIKRKPLREITLEEAKKDGFDSVEECQNCLMSIHNCSLDEIFDVIEFDPRWKKHKILNYDE